MYIYKLICIQSHTHTTHIYIYTYIHTYTHIYTEGAKKVYTF